MNFSVNVAGLLLAGLSGFAQQQTSLSKEDVVRMTQQGIAPATLAEIVRTSPRITFSATAQNRAELEKQGVAKEVTAAMLDRTYQGTELPPFEKPKGARKREDAVAMNAAMSVAPSVNVDVAASDWVLHEGTPIRLRLMRNLSSANAIEGANIDFETLDDISVNGKIVIPRNSIALATVTSAEAKKRMGRAGKLSVNIDYVRLSTGEKLALRGVEMPKAGGHVGAMTGAIVATSIVFWPAAPFFLFMHGKDAKIPAGHEVHVYVNSDYRVPH